MPYIFFCCKNIKVFAKGGKNENTSSNSYYSKLFMFILGAWGNGHRTIQ